MGIEKLLKLIPAITIGTFLGVSTPRYGCDVAGTGCATTTGASSSADRSCPGDFQCGEDKVCVTNGWKFYCAEAPTCYGIKFSTACDGECTIECENILGVDVDLAELRRMRLQPAIYKYR